MAIPKYEHMLLPILKCLSSGRAIAKRDITEYIVDHFRISPEDRELLLPAGKSKIIDNKTGWAIFYLKHAQLVNKVARAVYQITDRGQELLASNPSDLTAKDLMRYPEFVEFMTPKKDNTSVESAQPDPATQADTPQETIERHFQQLQENLKQEIMESIMNNSAQFFEELVVDLMIEMGYGGSKAETLRAVRTRSSHDGGIDGIINQDKLGTDVIYLQAKRWQNSVGSDEIDKFAGAIRKHKSSKGVFITTSTFTKSAIEAAQSSPDKIILIDGDKLTDLMFEHNLGVEVVETYHLKELASEYFQG